MKKLLTILIIFMIVPALVFEADARRTLLPLESLSIVPDHLEKKIVRKKDKIAEIKRSINKMCG